jgi:hypothetical protein
VVKILKMLTKKIRWGFEFLGKTPLADEVFMSYELLAARLIWAAWRMARVWGRVGPRGAAWG